MEHVLALLKNPTLLKELAAILDECQINSLQSKAFEIDLDAWQFYLSSEAFEQLRDGMVECMHTINQLDDGRLPSSPVADLERLFQQQVKTCGDCHHYSLGWCGAPELKDEGMHPTNVSTPACGAFVTKWEQPIVGQGEGLDEF